MKKCSSKSMPAKKSGKADKKPVVVVVVKKKGKK